MTGQEARDDEREALIAEARAHLERAADAAPRSARAAIMSGEIEDQRMSLVARLADALAWKHPEPEWEYGVTTKWGVHEHPRLARAQLYAKEVREEIEQGRASGDLAYHGRIVRRTKAAAGPWVPVGEGEQ